MELFEAADEADFRVEVGLTLEIRRICVPVRFFLPNFVWVGGREYHLSSKGFIYLFIRAPHF